MSASAKPSDAAAPRRPGRAWRWVAVALGLLLGLPVLLVGLALLAVNTAPGRDGLARLASDFVPGLTIEGLQGPLPGSPGIGRLTMADDQGVWLEVEGARLAWDPLALLRREAHVETLSAGRIALHRLPAGEAQPEPAQPGPLIPRLPELPVAIRLDRLEAERIEIGAPVLGEPVVLRLSGQARLDEMGLSLGLDAGLPEGGATLTADASLRPATGRLQARARLRGDAGGQLSRIAGLAERPLALDLSLDGPAEGARLNLTAAAGEGLGAELSGVVRAPDTARLGATLEGRIDGSGLVTGPLAGLAGPVELRLDGDRMPDGTFALRTLRAAGTPGVVAAEGRVDTSGAANAVKLHLALPASSVFAALLPGETVGWDAVEAEADVTGRLDAPVVAATVAPSGFRSDIAPLAALLGPAPRLALRGAAPDRIETLTLVGQALQAEVRGRVGETLDLTYAADVSAPGAAVPGLSGALRLRGTAAGAAADPNVTLDVESDRLEAAGRVIEALNLSARVATPATRPQLEANATGRLEELPLSLALRAAPEDAGWVRLEAADLSFGPARVTANGRLHPTDRLAEGEARLDAPDLAPFARLLGRPIAGAVRLEARGAPRDGVQTLNARIEVPRLSAAGVEARGVTATAEGSLAALDIALSGRANDVEAEARARVTEEGGARRLDLAALRATGFGETVRLAAPTRVTLRPDGAVEVAATTLALPRSGTLRAEGLWGPERADLRAVLSSVNLAALAAFAPDLAPAGTVNGEARVTGPTASPEVTATIRGTGLRAGIPAARGLPAGEVTANLRRAGSGEVSANAEARLGPAQRLAVTARFPRGPAADAPFEASLDGGLDLGPLTAPLLAAGADRVTGRLALALRASGTPNAPQLGGEARLSGGSYRNAVQGITVTDLAGTLRPDGQRLRADIAGRTSGNGRLAVAGTVEPFGTNIPVDVTVTAANAQPLSSDILRATLDADLRLAGELTGAATLSGRVRVDRAEIRIPERLPNSVRTLGPVTERGTPPGRAPRPVQRAAARQDAAGGSPIALDVQVVAPRNIYVRGRGVDAELGGELRVAGTVAAPRIEGDLEMRRGDIAVIGRRLSFERGRLTWAGELLPELDFRATSQTGQVTVRLDVTGSPTDPQLTFSSTPELPQDEVLARLLFDRPLNDLSPLEIAQLASAAAGAAGLPGGGATGVLDRVRQGLGLDRLSVGSASETASRNTSAQERNGATLEAGRYVADGVYVGVRQGTEAGSSRVGVRVDLSRRFRLEAETGDREAGNRVGLSYEYQWGR
jgi:translocation and assembly module TamB